MARILAERYGFTCTVLFAINKTTGVIDTNTLDNIPGLEALDHADAMVLVHPLPRPARRPDEAHHRLLDAGKGILGLRTATHAFKYRQSADVLQEVHVQQQRPGFKGGFGRWCWARRGSTTGAATAMRARAACSPRMRPAEPHPARHRRWRDLVLHRRLPGPLPLLPGSTPLVMGQVLTGPTPADPPVEGPKNTPMMPVAWTRTYTGPAGKPARVFTTTMGGKMGEHADWDNEGLRRLLVNATFWATGLEDKIPAEGRCDTGGR
jgi:hypothetical protein